MSRHPRSFPLTGLGLLASVVACSACGGSGAPPETTTESLGSVAFGVSCAEAVVGDFDHAVALFHHMTYPVARSEFEAVSRDDPECAMAYWGMAMTYFQPLWPNRPTEADLERGWELLREARRRGPRTEREELFVAAGEAFFDPTADPEYWARIERWAAATTSLYEAFPEDLEAEAFFALAHLATASRAGAPAEHHARAAEVLEGVLAVEPTHPGAVHYTIHANDFAGRQDLSIGVVRRYGEIAPRNPHALHMPTHIFVRRGEWADVIDWNLRAADAALAQRVGPDGRYVWDEYPHAVEYLVYAYLQRGDDSAAQAALTAMHETPDLQPTFKTAFHLASTPARFAVERKDWTAAARLPVRSPSTVDWDLFPWPEAVVWFARGLAAARSGDPPDESIDRLAELSAAATAAGEAPFATQIEILRLELSAWRAHVLGDDAEAVRLLQDAGELEDRTPKHPVTPAPTLPARELLGDLYLELGDPERALAAYRASEAAHPARFNSILGMARGSAALGDDEAARAHYERLLALTVDGSTREGAREAQSFLGR